MESSEIQEKNWVLKNFTAASNGHKMLKEKALQSFRQLGFPNPKNEDWKYTDVAFLAKQDFASSERRDSEGVNIAQLEALLPLQVAGPKLVFVNGFLCNSLSSQPEALPKGLKFSSTLEKGYADKLSSLLPYEEKPFVALNTALLGEGAYIEVSDATHIEEPLTIIHLARATDKAVSVHPRLFLRVGKNAHLSLLEAFVAQGDQAYLNNPVSEINLEDAACLEYCKLQQDTARAIHIANHHFNLKKSAQLKAHSFAFGSRLLRNELSLLFSGEGANCSLSGLSIAGSAQHVDNNTTLDHARPNCFSRQLFKGIYADKASGVFQGTIIVRPEAQKTNAIQSNQSLLLSKEASINTKPQLKIWADDVKCTHGATVGQLDETALFYLRSRGVSLPEARRMLIQAFASDIVSSVSSAALKGFLEESLLAKLKAAIGSDALG